MGKISDSFGVKEGMVFQIDGIITIPMHEDIEESVSHFLLKICLLKGELSKA
jgi:hypothetical protein